MNKPTASPMSEATLWRLYRRLLGEHLLQQRLPAPRGSSPSLVAASGIAAALTENLLPGDTLGLAPGDLATRYLCGVPLGYLRDAAGSRRARRKDGGWALPQDAEHAILPCVGAEQASLALGTAVAARLHQSGSMTVSLEAGRKGASSRAEPVHVWEQAAQRAVALQLPMLFIASTPVLPAVGPRRPSPALPSIPVDRNDALALYRVIYESAARARSGGGPTWIECRAWPLPAGGPSPENALEKMEEALRSRKLFNRQQQRQMQHALEREFDKAGWPPA